MSDNGSSNTSDNGEEISLYECRKCPGQRFTAAEKDTHRATHNKTRKPGPKSRGRGRASSPARSELTLFDPIVVEGTGEEEVVTPSPKRGKRKKSASPAPADKKNKKERRKRESAKRYNPEHMPTTRFNSG